MESRFISGGELAFEEEMKDSLLMMYVGRKTG